MKKVYTLILLSFMMMGIINAQTAYISIYSGNTVLVVDALTNAITNTITVGNSPAGVSVSPDGTKVYVTNATDNTVSVINAATNSVTATIAVGTEPLGIDINPDGTKVYVCNVGDSTVSVINALTNTVIATIAVGGYPDGIVVTPDGTKVYEANSYDSYVTVINALTNTVLDSIIVGNSPANVCVTPNGSKVYVSNYMQDVVRVIDPVTDSVTGLIYVGQNPLGLVVSPDGTTLYVANSAESTVSVINTSSDMVIATISVGDTPEGISVSPDGTKVFTVNVNSNDLSVINTSDNTVTATIPVSAHPQSMGNFISTYPCAVPYMPAQITGNTTVCVGTVQTYSINNVTSALDYTWTLPNGWTGTSTSTSITTTVDTSSGIVSVKANNDCGSSSVQTLNVYVMQVAPPLGNIFGPDTACQGSVVTYYVLPDNSATSYTWTLPSSWSGTSSSNSITVTVGSNSGIITVIANNMCGSSVASLLPVIVNNSPSPISFVGPNPVCAGSVVTYHDNTINNSGDTYSWTLPNGWTGSSSTNSITVTVGSTGGAITVLASNQCVSSNGTVFNYTGTISSWTVPAGITSLFMQTWGAQGGGGPIFNGASSLPGGYGAYMSGTFAVNPGDVLDILVGQQGGTGASISDPQGNENGGGGGTFIVNDAGNVPLLISGGGGGGPSLVYGTSCIRTPSDGDASITTSGNTINCNTLSAGGTNGTGGSSSGIYQGGAGGGFTTDGEVGGTQCAPAYGGSAYLNGGAGGTGNTCYSTANYGGYGGGGGGQLGGPGGGGGYSGGGSAGSWSAYSSFGGGGGSYNAGTNQTNIAGVQSGDGQAIISSPTSINIVVVTNVYVTFNLFADTSIQHHYFITDSISGVPPYQYLWSWGDGNTDTIAYPSHTYLDSGFYTICLSVTDSTGCQGTFCDSSYHIMRNTNQMVYVNVIPIILTSTHTNVITNVISVYPNPATNTLTILQSTHIANQQLIITNILGEEIYHQPITNTQSTIDISNWSDGVYIYQLNDSNETVRGKFVKQ